jgi:hypothetical protein
MIERGMQVIIDLLLVAALNRMTSTGFKRLIPSGEKGKQYNPLDKPLLSAQYSS